MRIDRLELLAWGPFTDQILDLSDGDHGLHLIHGENEAGKSTTLRALIAWLFGVPERTTDDHLHDKAQLRIGGQLRLSDQRVLEFWRKKGRKHTLLRPGSLEPLEDEALAAFLPPGMDEALFCRLWGIDHERLVTGGRDLLEQSGDLGQALFSAATGTANLRSVLQELRSDAENLFKARSSKSAVNQAVAEYKKAQKLSRDACLPVAEWQKLQKDLQAIDAELDQVEQALAERLRIRSRLERVRRVRGDLAQRRNLLTILDTLRNVALLPADFSDAVRGALLERRQAVEARERLTVKGTRLRQEADLLHVRSELLDHEDELLELHKQLGAAEKALADLPMQDGKRRQLRNEAELLLKGVRPDATLDDAEALRPLLNKKRLLAELAKKSGQLILERDQLEADGREQEAERTQLEHKLASLGPAGQDLERLRAAVAGVRKAGDVEKRAGELGKQVEHDRLACASEFKRLGCYGGDMESLLGLPLPVAETLDRFERADDALLAEERALEGKKREHDETLARVEAELRVLVESGVVPSVAELTDSRRDRDACWGFIRARYVRQEAAPDAPGEFATDPDVAGTFERKVEGADRLADRLREASDRVVRRAELETQRESLRLALSRLDAAADGLRLRQEALAGRWNAVWETLGIAAGTPREMKQWLLRAERLIERLQAVEILADGHRALVRKCAALRESLLGELPGLFAGEEPPAEGLEALVSWCEQRLRQEDERLKARRQYELELDQVRRWRLQAAEKQKRVDTALQGWTRDWTLAIEGLGVDASAPVELVTETFERLSQFFEKLDKADETRKRIYGMEKVRADFEQRVDDFAESIGYPREGRDAFILAGQLHRELNEAKVTRARLDELLGQLRELTREFDDTGITLRTADEKLAGLRATAGVDDDETLVTAGAASDARRGHLAALDALERSLRSNGDGLELEQLEAEALASDADAMDAELERCLRELEELSAKRDVLRDDRRTLQIRIGEKDGSPLAAAAAEDAESQLAAIVAGAGQYLRLQMASLILERHIERYRRQHQAPVLAKAGELFSRLTLGSFAGLRDELDHAGKPVLLGVRPDHREVPMEGMSAGTRDQLYLALRLASLERHLANAEPMPLILDDLLVSFDDPRSRVCLELLAELALRTQVLLFTHHRRILELAADLRAPAGVFTHHLGRP